MVRPRSTLVVRSLATRGLPTLVGWLVIAVALDWGLGAAYTAVVGEREEAPTEVATEAEGQIPLDARADGEGMAAYPWAEAYFDELNRLRYDYSPFVLGRLGHNEGRFINTTPAGRASYVPDLAAGDDAVDIWFFGGSTMFGEGQRDEHTIPSEVARLAEADGLAVRPHNIAQQGLVAWQELVIFERELARRPAPDLVVFYDGTNDYNAQLEVPSDHPVHYDAGDFWGRVAPEDLPVPQETAPPEATLWQRYSETSLLGTVLRSVAGVDPAGAQEADADPDPVERMDEVADIYLRMVDLATALAERHGVRPVFFWQPVRDEPDSVYSRIARSLPPPTIDLSRVLDDPPAPVFIDGGHTNELGAALVAEAMYPHLEPLVRAVGP